MTNRTFKIILVCIIFVVACFTLAGCSLGNRQVGIDFTQSFDEAYIYGLDGSLVVHGNIVSYRDFSESDVVQIQIGNKIYLTHYVNVIMIRDQTKH